MKDIRFFTEKKFKQYMADAELFKSQGVQGETYKKGDLVIKIMNSNCDVSERSLLQYRNIYIPDIYFIRAGIYVRRKIKAYISEYASGHSITEVRVYGQRINVLLNAISRFEKAIRSLCQKGIRIGDINNGNVLFSEDHFNIIDTVLYRDGSYLTAEELAKLNYDAAFGNLFYGIMPPMLYEYFYSKDCFLSDSLQRPEELAEKILGQIEHIIGGPVDTLGEATRIIDEERIKLP